MKEIFSELFSTILQIGLFTLIPFLFFLFRGDKTIKFNQYIGLYKPPSKSIIYVLLVSLLFLMIGIGMTFFDSGIKEIAMTPASVTGRLRMMGFSTNTILVLLIIALLKTSLAEEILFRGFIAKRLIKKYNFIIGNILQALIFGVLHLLLFWALTNSTFFPLAFMFILSSIAGWTLGYIKEKYAKGSIIPGWIAHGVGNVLSYITIAFIL